MAIDIERQNKERVFWDGFADKYDSFLRIVKGPYKIAYGELEKYVEPSKVILEIGTGPGTVAFDMARTAKNVYACDISSEMIKIAQKKLEATDIQNIEFTVQDAYNLEYETESFDLAVASNVLHVMISPEKALASIHRALKKNGIFIAPTYCHGSSIITRMISSLMSLRGFKEFHKWSPQTFRDFLESNGYEIIQYKVIKDAIPFVFAAARKTNRGPLPGSLPPSPADLPFFT
jgi:ubiquinone/menaquinone biosynthesis C-methylase UbiE